MRPIGDLIRAFAKDPTEDLMSRLVNAAVKGLLGESDLLHLSNAMGTSGAVCLFDKEESTADIASTGGPSSLSTLLCPLYLRSYGFLIPALGVPGRPAGGVDVLAQLSGYRIRLKASDIPEIIERCGYAHFLADSTFAPLDAKLFRYRQTVGAQGVAALAVASLLAKKITTGVKYVGLDVRVAPHGNLGKTLGEAKEAALLFCNVAKLAGINAAAILTDARIPYQPFIGRGEALLAIKSILSGRSDPWLTQHSHQCHLMAAQVASLANKTKQTRSPELGRVFLANLEAQGSSLEAFEEKTEAIEKSTRRQVIAENDGFFKLDILALRAEFMNAHANDGTIFLDRLGVTLEIKPGSYVKKGDLLASVRADYALWNIIKAAINQIFQVVDVTDNAQGIEEILHA